MNKLTEIEVLTQSVLELDLRDLSISDDKVENIPDEFRIWWKSTENLLSTILQDRNYDSELLTFLLTSINKVLNYIPAKVYGMNLPIVQKLLWFCDDYLEIPDSPDKVFISKFHVDLLDFRSNNSSSFSSKKYNFTDDYDSEVGRAFDEAFTNQLEDNQLLEQLILCSETDLPSLLDKHLSACTEEKDYEELGELIWNLFQHHYFRSDNFVVVLPSWLKVVRRITFQCKVPSLLFNILAFLPTVLEQTYSFPFKYQRQNKWQLLFDEAIKMTRQIQFSSEFSKDLNSILCQYWKFFFYFLRHQKLEAFESFFKVFIVLMETDFAMSKGRNTYSAVVSEVYYVLESQNRVEYGVCIRDELLKSIETGSVCFQDLFPLQGSSSETLNKNSLLDAVIYEALKDGNIDSREREILLKLFSALKLDKEEVRNRMNSIQRQISEGISQTGAMNSRDMMLKLFRIAFKDGVLEDAERQLLNMSGHVLGMKKVEVQELFFLAREEARFQLTKPLRISSFVPKSDFELHWNSFQAESIRLEEIKRELKVLIASNQLTMEGDRVDWGELEGVPINVEISRMSEKSQIGVFFFVGMKGALLLREILQSLTYIIVVEGQFDSKIRLRLCDKSEVVVHQDEGFQVDDELQNILNVNGGRVTLVLVDADSREVLSHSENGCGLISSFRWEEGETALDENNIAKLNLICRRASRELPGDRFTRNIKCQSLINMHQSVSSLNEFEKYYQYVIENDPNDFEFLYMFGISLYEAGRTNDALKVLKLSLKSNQKYMPSLLLICKMLQDDPQAAFYLYLKKLQVYFWDHTEVRAYLNSFSESESRAHFGRLSETPFLLN